MAMCRQNSNCYSELLGLSNALAAGTHNRDCPRIGADGLSLRQSLGPPHVAKRRWHRPQRDNMIGSPGIASPKVSGLGAGAHILSGTPEAV